MAGTVEAPSRRRPWRAAGAVFLGAVPWVWFLVRDVLWVVGDVLAIALPLVVAGLVVSAVLASLLLPRLWVLAVSTLLAGSVAIGGPWLPADEGTVGGRGVTVAAANIDGVRELGDVVGALGGDVVVVAEPSAAVEERLFELYPHVYIRSGPAPEMSVFSRHPMRLLEAAGPDLPGDRIEIAGPQGAFVLYAVHVPRPWFRAARGAEFQVTVVEHQRLVEQVAASVVTETLPVVLAGDLNSTDRGRDYRTLVGAAGLVDAMRDAPGAPTSVGKWTPLLARIDHVLVSQGWCGDDARRAELPGSAHRAVVARVGPCAP